MKKILLLLCVIAVGLTARADRKCYNKLAEVNKCWTEQADITTAAVPAYTEMSERSWIRLHLDLVEQTLRQRNNHKLTTDQKTNRDHCLDILHRYWQEGNFPINDQYAYRTPIFIDKHNNFCAVGFLLKETGYESVSRKISAEINLAYVRQMNDPELTEWAVQNGFSVDELAWIQPSYPPNTSCLKVGAGVDGMVQELYVDEAEEKMYVGGSFIQADKSIMANNIAYVTEASGVYTWHNMGSGVHGTVNAITQYEGKIFAAGAFDEAGGKLAGNIAFWNGTEWIAAGCVKGTVQDLLVFEGKLFACGEFNDCSGSSGGNFAQWNGTDWTIIPGIDGRINTMESNGSSIVLGGAFSYGAVMNAVQWNAATSFVPFANSIKNEVMDFDVYQDTLYAACKRANTTDTNEILVKLRDGKWMQGLIPRSKIEYFSARDRMPSFHTLCPEETSLNIGGSFYFNAFTYGSNCYNMNADGKWSAVDSTVNKMVLFKKVLYFGGAFKTGTRGSEELTEEIKGLNGIAGRILIPTSIAPVTVLADKINVYPNPAQGGTLISAANNINARDYTLYEMNGKAIATGTLDHISSFQLPAAVPGVYFLNLSNDKGERLISKVIIK